MENKVQMDFDIASAYAQLAVHTLKKSGTEITPKEIKKEMEMLYKKFEPDEIIRLTNIITKGNK